jgi:hypothetical protein
MVAVTEHAIRCPLCPDGDQVPQRTEVTRYAMSRDMLETVRPGFNPACDDLRETASDKCLIPPSLWPEYVGQVQEEQ